MSLQNKDKINRLLAELPEGVAAPSSWLTKLGITRQLVQKYVKGGWLVALGHGAYARPGRPVHSAGALHGFHQLLGIKCHLSGKISLATQGYSHYLPIKWGPVWDVTTGGSIPSWLRHMKVHPPLRFRTDKLFTPSVERNDFALWTTTAARDWTLPLSCVERAMLELLDDVKNAEDFQLASDMFASMATLRPGMVSTLLRDCRSIKAKRLFLLLAEYYNHPWFRKVDTSNVNLGSGKRQLIKGGKLHVKYAITIPGDFGVEH